MKRHKNEQGARAVRWAAKRTMATFTAQDLADAEQRIDAHLRERGLHDLADARKARLAAKAA